MTFDWHYKEGYVDVSMPGYIKEVLRRLQHIRSKRIQYSPHEYLPIHYGKHNATQYASSTDTSPTLPITDTRYIQSVVGSFLYYSRAMDSTILPTLNTLSSQQAAPTKTTMDKAQRLMDYAATYPDAYLRYYASNMVLHCDSDASYLVMPKARSRYAGFFYFKTDNEQLNAPIHIECKTLKHVVSSAAEAETGGIFGNAQFCIPLRYILEAMNHTQPPTPLKTDNSTALGYIHNNIQLKRSKSWDMRHHWLRDKETHKLIRVFWESGLTNEADYFTKHHPVTYHRAMRPRYVRDKVRHEINMLTSYCKGVLIRA